MRTFRRSLGTRLLSVSCLLFFSTLEVYHLATGGRLASFGGISLGLLLLLSAGATLLNLGDRYRIDEAGVMYDNPLLALLGIRLDRRVSWTEVEAVRAHRAVSHGTREDKPSVLFLSLKSGGRFVIDSVEEMDEIRSLIFRHLSQEADEP